MAGLRTPGQTLIVPKKVEETIVSISWRGIEFPITNLQTNMEQSLVEHEYPDRDAAFVESTGRKSLVVTCTAVFNNYIVPASSEAWTQADLFPNTYLKFIQACQDSSPGDLVHPFFGKFTAKCRRANTTLDAQNRGGVTVECEWIETTNIESKSNLDTSRMMETATELYEVLDALPDGLVKQSMPNKVSFFELLDSISSLVSLVGMVGNTLLMTIDKALYHINKLLFAIKQANSNTNGQLLLLAQRLKAALITTKRRASFGLTQTVVSYRPPADTTLVDLSRKLSYPLIDLMKLNPRVAGRPLVPAGTPILYIRQS